MPRPDHDLPAVATIRWSASAGLTPAPRADGAAGPRRAPSHDEAPRRGRSGGRKGGRRPSPHGHAPGAQAIPRWK